MSLQSAVNTFLATAVMMTGINGCATKEKDPLDELKRMIPKIEDGLNSRDLAALQRMGTERFESNALVIDVFGERVRDSVRLSLAHIQQDGTDATLTLNMIPHDPAGQTRQLHLNLLGDGKWRIDTYEVVDSAGSGS